MSLLPRAFLAAVAAAPLLLAISQGSAGAATCDDELLKLGSEGKCVVEMKELLNKNCTEQTRLTGTSYFGQQTRTAVYNVQKLRFPDNKKRHTGMVGRNAWSALRSAGTKTTDCTQPIDKDSSAATQHPGAETTGTAKLSASVVAVWDKVAKCESSGKWDINSGNGYYGGLQFSPSTWKAHGGKGLPHEASKEDQILIAQKTLAEQGPNAWPHCSKVGGLTRENGK